MGKWLLQHISQSLVKEKGYSLLYFSPEHSPFQAEPTPHVERAGDRGRCSMSPPTPLLSSCFHYVSTLLPLLTLP